jgi:hypothetical protein
MRTSATSGWPAHLNEPPPRITDLRPELPEPFDAVFETALAKSPGDRYSTCGELAKAAHKARQGKVLRRKRRLVLAGAALIAAAGAVAGGLLATETGRAHAASLITRNSIDGAELGFKAPDYKKLLGGWRASELRGGAKFSSLAFQQPEVAAYFPPARREPASSRPGIGTTGLQPGSAPARPSIKSSRRTAMASNLRSLRFRPTRRRSGRGSSATV